MQFRDVIGQEAVGEHLVRMADAGRIGHALLFTGAEGVGALPLAMAFAQYVNCTGRTGGDSCGVCPSCVQMSRLAHPDVHFIFPVNKSKTAEASGNVEGDKPVSDHFMHLWRKQVAEAPAPGYFSEQAWYRTIDIDNKQGFISRHEAGEIIRKLSYKAFESAAKILILWLPERMNEQAANALLKILEEPWENTYFFFVSEAPDRLLPTIVSRTQEIAVPGVECGALALWLAGREEAAGKDAGELARLSFGSVTEALRLAAEGADEDEHFTLFVQLMRLAFEDRHMQLLEWAETVAGMGRENQKGLLENILRLLREAYMLSIGMQEVAYLHGKELEFCRRFAPYVNGRNIEALVRETERALLHVVRNGNPKIVFTHYALLVSKLIVRI